jgi:hypothetical protein
MVEAELGGGPPPSTPTELAPLRVLMPVGMLGGGFPASTISRGIALGADAIVVDGGSTDSGPHYLGAATAKTSRAAVKRDVRVLLGAARRAHIPLVIGSCGTSGTDAGVEWVDDITKEVAQEEALAFSVARIYSEQRAHSIVRLLEAGRIRHLDPAGPLRRADVERCSHIVAVMGHEPIADALQSGADVVLAGRATDTALMAAVALPRGLPDGPVWHGAKTSECGGLCTNAPTSGGVLVSIDSRGFTVEPLAPEAACTPFTVAAHMLYENADPFRMREPAGVLDTSGASYEALDDRRVRVEGSTFELRPPTIKLEGAAPVGYQTILIVGMRNPAVLSRIDEWCDRLRRHLETVIESRLELDPTAYDVRIRRYGHDAVLGTAEPERDTAPREVGIVFVATAATQEMATEIAKVANPMLLHAPLPSESAMPSYAFLGSPAEIERGQVYEFTLCHAVDVDDPRELFRTRMDRIGP